MKKLTFSLMASLAVAATSFAGVSTAGKDYKDYKTAPPVTCFNDQELQLDLFGSYTDTTKHGRYGDGFGGGVGVNYFFMRYIGIGASGNVFDGGANGVWNATGSLIFRYPIDSICLAPYVFGGGGVLTDGVTVGSYHAGGGLEYRVVPHRIGLFAEGRYTWAEDVAGAEVRVGVRVVF